MFADVKWDLTKRIWKRRLLAAFFLAAVTAAVVYFRVEHPASFNQTVDIAEKTIVDIKARLF